MTLIIIILVVLAVLLAAGLIWTGMQRKKDRVGRERASELRSDAATTAAGKAEQEARAREAQAEADRVRAQADKLEVRAHEERTSYDMTQAQQENAVREADRVDPDVDHSASEYQPDLNGSPTHRAEPNGTGVHAQRQSSGPANPVPPGPETIVPSEHNGSHRDQI